MGIADQFKDKAQELADQGKQKKAGNRQGEARERSSERSERRPDQPGLGDRAQDMTDEARERFDR